MSKLVPVTSEEFGSKWWCRNTGYEFAAADTVCPLVSSELSTAVLHLPIALYSEGSSYLAAAILGMENQKNLVVGPGGKWLLGYVPACYRVYPFQSGKLSNGKLALCYDEESGLLSESSNERALPFFVDGKLSEALSDISKMLNLIATGLDETANICQLLGDLDLIRPWEVVVKKGEENLKLEGLFTINEKKLVELSDEDFLRLRHGNALDFAQYLLLSRQHLPKLSRLFDLQKVVKDRLAQTGLDSSLLDVLGENDSLNFDNI